MTAVDMCALHPAELLTLTGSKGWMDLCTTQVALGFTKQCAAFFEKCAVPEGTTASGVDPWSGAPMCSEFGGGLLHDLKVQLYDCDPAADPFDLMPRHDDAPPPARHRGTVLTVGVAVVIAALFLAAQLVIMRHKRKEELARATGGYHFPVEINFPPDEP